MLPPEGNTVAFWVHRNSVGSKVCEVCLVGRTERARQRRGEEAECVWERKNTKQKVRRDNWVGGHETEMYSEGVCVCLCVWTWGLCMRSCISSGVSRCVKALIRSRALASVCAHVYACAFVCLKTIPLPHYPVSSSPALMRSLTITVVIKVKPRPKHRIRHTRQTHTLRSHSEEVIVYAQPQLATHLQ